MANSRLFDFRLLSLSEHSVNQYANRDHSDPREGYQSSKSSSHLLRSILQHFYRLEDTTDREPNQVRILHHLLITSAS